MKIQGVTSIVTKHLRDQIITGELSPGERLNEIELAARIEISRQPLREAFRKLEYEKLVVSVPRKGTCVSGISIRDCEQLFYVRKLLECAAIDCLEMNQMRRLPMVEESLSVAEGLPESFPSREEPQQMLDYYRVMAAFHEKLVESSENRWLIHSYSSLRGNLARYQILYLNLPGSRQASMHNHLEILGSIKEGDFAGTRKFLNNHIDNTAKRIKEKMNRAEMGVRIRNGEP